MRQLVRDTVTLRQPEPALRRSSQVLWQVVMDPAFPSVPTLLARLLTVARKALPCLASWLTALRILPVPSEAA